MEWARIGMMIARIFDHPSPSCTRRRDIAATLDLMVGVLKEAVEARRAISKRVIEESSYRSAESMRATFPPIISELLRRDSQVWYDWDTFLERGDGVVHNFVMESTDIVSVEEFRGVLSVGGTISEDELKTRIASSIGPFAVERCWGPPKLIEYRVVNPDDSGDSGDSGDSNY